MGTDLALAIASLVTFALVVILIFKQPAFKLPFINKALRVDYGTAPVLGVLILLATFSINQESIINGIVGNSTVQPYAILVLFMALAYICISLDSTGLFAYLAVRATFAAGNSGRKLFLYFFLLSSFLTMFTSNDIVILTITPIIYYFAKNTKIDPVPFLIAQFFAANIWSIALYTGNPTNIIVAQAYTLSFIEYSKWMILPTIAAGAMCLAILWVIFRRKIPAKTVPATVNPATVLKDKNGAIFGTICLGTCLACLNFASVLHIPIWQITLVFASIVASRDALLSKKDFKRGKPELANGVLFQNLKRMPWKIIPFIIGMFVLVESLLASDYLKIFTQNLNFIKSNVVLACFGIAALSCFLANLMSNQPMTILLTKILQGLDFSGAASAETAGLYALILGSNFAANFTLIGSLAGLMWSKLLRDKGVKISFKEFSKYGFLIMPLTLIAACSVLTIEILLLL
ncbi:MAG: SLC13 family permease [Candidatus Bathyarchaeota archaeon]|nr:SLC13 family permease [Candidatus Bathyarchaeota archaeon]